MTPLTIFEKHLHVRFHLCNLSGQDCAAGVACQGIMADSSIITLGTARSLLVDVSVCDSRMVDHTFLDVACDDMEGWFGVWTSAQGHTQRHIHVQTHTRALSLT